MAAKIYLKMLDHTVEGAVILALEEGARIESDDPEENLACGSCKRVLFRNMSTRTLHAKIIPGGVTAQIAVKCPCGQISEIRPKLIG